MVTGISPESPTQFTPQKPSYQTRPDLISQGKIMDNVSILNGANADSLSVQVDVGINQVNSKTIQVMADQAVSYTIYFVLDESEVDGSGNLVWRQLDTGPITCTANVLSAYNFSTLFRQIKINVANASGSTAVVNAWLLSTN